jgi:hypothetical protein
VDLSNVHNNKTYVYFPILNLKKNTKTIFKLKLFTMNESNIDVKIFDLVKKYDLDAVTWFDDTGEISFDCACVLPEWLYCLRKFRRFTLNNVASKITHELRQIFKDVVKINNPKVEDEKRQCGFYGVFSGAMVKQFILSPRHHKFFRWNLQHNNDELAKKLINNVTDTIITVSIKLSHE